MGDSVSGAGAGQSGAGTGTGTDAAAAQRAEEFQQLFFDQLSLQVAFEGNSDQMRLDAEYRERRQQDETAG